MTKHLTVVIDQELHKQFRLACLENGKTMREEIEAFIKEYIKRKERGK